MGTPRRVAITCYRELSAQSVEHSAGSRQVALEHAGHSGADLVTVDAIPSNVTIVLAGAQSPQPLFDLTAASVEGDGDDALIVLPDLSGQDMGERVVRHWLLSGIGQTDLDDRDPSAAIRYAREVVAREERHPVLVVVESEATDGSGKSELITVSRVAPILAAGPL